MKRRASRSPQDISKMAAESLSDVRRAEITSAVNKIDDSSFSVKAAVAHSPLFPRGRQ